MKLSLLTPYFKALALIFILNIFSVTGFSQTDTLRIYYSGLQTKTADSNDTKIAEWAKKLNGRHVDVEVLAYYNQSDFKKFATERSDEMFLTLNRKARDLITITSIGPKKGQKSQRSVVDIVYKTTGSVDPPKEKELANKKNNDDSKKTYPKKENTKPPVKNKDKKDNITDNDEKESDKEKDEKKNVTSKEKDKKGKKEKKVDMYGRPNRRQSGEGQFVKRSEVQQIKASKIIVAQTGNKEGDDALFTAVKNYWTFTSDVTTMPYKDAKALAKTDEKVLVFILTKVYSKSLPHNSPSIGTFAPVLSIGNVGSPQYTEVSAGNALMIENGKGKILASSCIPAFGDQDYITGEILAFGVAAINYQLKTMDERDMPNNLKYESAYKELSLDKLKERTLYIPEGWLSDKLKKEEISEIYKAKSEVVSYETWKDAILSKKEGVAYVIIVPRPLGGEFLYIHYLMDAQTGMILAMSTPKGASISGINISKGNTGQINKRNIEKYNDALSGDW